MRKYYTSGFVIGLLMMLIITLVSCVNGVQSTNDPQAGVVNENRVPGEYIVVIEREDAEDIIRALYSAYALQRIKDLGRGRYLINLASDPGPDIVIQHALESADVEMVQPNYRYRYQ